MVSFGFIYLFFFYSLFLFLLSIGLSVFTWISGTQSWSDFIFGHETISELFHLLRPAACSNLCFKGVVSIVSLSACTEHHPKPLASGLTRASQVTWRTCVSSNPQEPISGFHHQQVSGFDQMYSFVSQFCGYPCLIFKTGSAFFFLINFCILFIVSMCLKEKDTQSVNPPCYCGQKT